MEPMLLRPEEVAECLRIGRTQVFRLLREGKIGSVMIGARRRRIPIDALRDYVDRLRQEQEGRYG